MLLAFVPGHIELELGTRLASQLCWRRGAVGGYEIYPPAAVGQSQADQATSPVLVAAVRKHCASPSYKAVGLFGWFDKLITTWQSFATWLSIGQVQELFSSWSILDNSA